MKLPAWVISLACALLTARAMHAQVRRHLITESTVTFGRGGALRSNDSFIAGAVTVVDLGVRWTWPSGLGLGVSVFGGRDFPNEATLVGARARLSRAIHRSRLEGSLALVASSIGSGGIGHARGFGASVGMAWYPVPWTAVIAQVDFIPTWKGTGVSPGAAPSRSAALSAGVRLGGRAGLVSWIGAGIVGVLAAAISN
ncbi:MAG: hypothetical protein ACREMW_14920 [Gemmatimonadales bacterium]